MAEECIIVDVANKPDASLYIGCVLIIFVDTTKLRYSWIERPLNVGCANANKMEIVGMMHVNIVF